MKSKTPCVGAVLKPMATRSTSCCNGVHVCVCACARACVCVCVCVYVLPEKLIDKGSALCCGVRLAMIYLYKKMILNYLLNKS